jgi:hypothetical protein
MTGQAVKTEPTPEIAAWLATMTATVERCAAQIAEGGHDRRVSLRNGYDEVIITLTGNAHLVVWEVEGVGLHHTSHGANVGDTHSRCFLDLDQARDYANGWVADLTAKGYQTR